MQLSRLVVALALAVGCSKQPVGAMVTCSPPECAYTTPLALVAEVDPPPMGAYVRQEFTQLTIDAKTGRFTLKLDTPVTLSGSVKVAMNGRDVPLQASVVATRPSRISGRPDLFYQTAADPMTGAYQLVVTPNIDGESYVVRVTPSDPARVPPMQVTVSAAASQALDFAYPDPATLPELHGTVRDSLQNALADMQVQATDPDSGAVLSTTVVTDHAGQYSLRLLQSRPATVKLTAAPAPTMKPGAMPPIMLSRAVTMMGMPIAGASAQADLQLPPLPAAAHITYVVSGTGPSGAQTPVVGATCSFSADVSDPNSLDGVVAGYVASTVTDAKGNASVDLVPAVSGNRTYQVTIKPDVSSSFQAKTTTVDVAPQGGYAQLGGLSIRPQLFGRVIDPTGKPLVDATITPVPATLAQSGAAPSSTAMPLTASPATAGADGRFSLRLDPGSWDVGLIPPADAMLPRLWLVGTNVVANTDVTTITVPRGVMVSGVVRDANNAAVPVADVRLYTVAAGNSNCAGSRDYGCLAPARLRAEGPTDASGIVGMILPSQPVD